MPTFPAIVAKRSKLASLLAGEDTTSFTEAQKKTVTAAQEAQVALAQTLASGSGSTAQQSAQTGGRSPRAVQTNIDPDLQVKEDVSSFGLGVLSSFFGGIPTLAEAAISGIQSVAQQRLGFDIGSIVSGRNMAKEVSREIGGLESFQGLSEEAKQYSKMAADVLSSNPRGRLSAADIAAKAVSLGSLSASVNQGLASAGITGKARSDVLSGLGFSQSGLVGMTSTGEVSSPTNVESVAKTLSGNPNALTGVFEQVPAYSPISKSITSLQEAVNVANFGTTSISSRRASGTSIGRSSRDSGRSSRDGGRSSGGAGRR